MDLIALLGFLAILLAILGLAGVIATTVGVEIALGIVGILLLAYGGRGRLRL
jgi:hypothetical protein